MMHLFMNIGPWVFVAIMLGPQFVKQFEASENWFQVASIVIPDTRRGSPVTMTVNRVIRQPFVADWVVTVRELRPEGPVIACTASGTSAYKTEAAFPTPLTLDWWTFPIRCDLRPGKYALDTVWRIDVGSSVTKTVTAASNAFEVRE